MEAVARWTETDSAKTNRASSEMHSRILRDRLVTLALNWESAALILDAERYKSQTTLERESLRDSANTYRKCIAEMTELLASAPL
ncbi:MAG: hypothetical protein ACTHMT_02655 [Verrucomicrobiota bacterium]